MPVLRKCVQLAGIALALAAPAAADAQQRQSTILSLAIVEEALSGSAVRDLEFGTVSPGVPRTVAAQDAQGCAGCASGLWAMTGLSPANAAQRRFVRVTWVGLPAALAGPGGATLPLNWTNAARTCVMRGGTQLHCVTTTPSMGASHSVQINGPGAPAAAQPGTNGRDLHLYLGGTATPAAGQPAGIYTGSITVRMEYSSS